MVERRVGNVLSRYHEEGILSSKLVESQDRAFSIPIKYIEYSNDLTVGQVLADVERRMEEGLEDLERVGTIADYIKGIAKAFARGTPFENKVTLNEQPKRDHLNIVVIDRDPLRLAPRFEESACSYIGYFNTIVCNGRRISSILGTLDEIDTNHSVVIAIFENDSADNFRVNFLDNIDVLKRLLKQNFLTWLIGHEIGHAILHKPWVVDRRRSLHFDLTYDRREQEADAFVAKLALNDPSLGANFGTILLEFIEHRFRSEYAERTGTSIDIRPLDGEPLEPLEFDTYRYEIPLVLRAVRIMRELLAQDEHVLERAHYSAVKGRFAFVHSLKFEDYVKFLESRIQLRERIGAELVPYVAFTLLLSGAIYALIWIWRKQATKTDVGSES